TTIEVGDEKDKNLSICMGKILNLLFQHISNRDDKLIPSYKFGSSQKYAGDIGVGLAERLDEKANKGMAPAIKRTMQLMLGLYNQLLYTRPGFSTVPMEYTQYGKDELLITEYRCTFTEIFKPLQYDREI